MLATPPRRAPGAAGRTSERASSSEVPHHQEAASSLATDECPPRLRERLTECLQQLNDFWDVALGGPDSPSAALRADSDGRQCHALRQSLLEEKANLTASMESLRATMRTLQEEGERRTTQAQRDATELMMMECRKTATLDDLDKVSSQLRRSREQQKEHSQACNLLRQHLDSFAAAFNDAVAQEVETQESMRIEIDQLRGVTEDLQTRVCSKAEEGERLRAANKASEEELDMARRAWRAARMDCVTALRNSEWGQCNRALQELLSIDEDGGGGGPQTTTSNLVVAAPPTDERLEARLEDTIAKRLACEDVNKSKLESLDLQVLRDMVSGKEEQLAALHAKIRFLSETDSPEQPSF